MSFVYQYSKDGDQSWILTFVGLAIWAFISNQWNRQRRSIRPRAGTKVDSEKHRSVRRRSQPCDGDWRVCWRWQYPTSDHSIWRSQGKSTVSAGYSAEPGFPASAWQSPAGGDLPENSQVCITDQWKECHYRPRPSHSDPTTTVLHQLHSSGHFNIR